MHPQNEFQSAPTAISNQSNSGSDKKDKRSNSTKFLLLTSLLLLVAGSIATYLYIKEKEDHGATKTELSNALVILDANKNVINESRYRSGIVKALQSPANRECYATKSALLFNISTTSEKNADGTIKKRYGIGQYVCTKGQDVAVSPIRFAVVQSRDNGANWEFTYGSSSLKPQALPDYIYNSDPQFLISKYSGVTKF